MRTGNVGRRFIHLFLSLLIFLWFFLQLQSTGRLLEEQLPEMMTELLAAVRDKMLCPSESQLTRSLLMEVIELHAHHWTPLEALTTAYYNRTIQKLTA